MSGSVSFIDQIVVQIVETFCFILEKTYHLVYALSINLLKMQNVYLCKLKSERGKWYLCCSHNPHKNNISNHLQRLNKGLDIYLKHNNLLMLGDFNSELKYSCLNKFSNVSNLKNLNEEPTCFKDRNNPSCMDLFLTNNRRYFQNTSTNEIGISDSIKWF